MVNSVSCLIFFFSLTSMSFVHPWTLLLQNRGPEGVGKKNLQEIEARFSRALEIWAQYHRILLLGFTTTRYSER